MINTRTVILNVMKNLTSPSHLLDVETLRYAQGDRIIDRREIGKDLVEVMDEWIAGVPAKVVWKY
ncbi:MAG: hypothetical protein HY800_03360 [Ignavibacteriales bacterium]|nr:hypothetical protein [Ignavibacteriales bacterium]